MNVYTVFIKKIRQYWVSLCLENGLVGQGKTPEQSIDKLKEAIDSFLEIYHQEINVYISPICIDELHEFLMMDNSESYELRKIYF